MNFELSDRERDLQRRARALVENVIMPYEQMCEEQNGLPDHVLSEMRARIKESGLAASNIPSAYGGAGCSVFEQVLVEEQLGALTNGLWDVVWRPANVLVHGTPEQREEYLRPSCQGRRRYAFAVTEAGAGSDPAAIQTTAIPRGDGYVINGEKWHVTVGDIADFLIVLARVPDGAAGLFTLFLVDKDTPGVRIKRIPRYMHTFVFEHPEFALEDVYVPAGKILGGLGEGMDLTKEWFMEERLMIAARCLGGAERGLRLASDFALNRVQFGRPIFENQSIQFMLADSATEIAAGRALLYRVARDADEGLSAKTLHAEAAMVKLFCSELAGRVIDRCVQVFGGRGYMREQPVERLYRDLRVDRIWEGTSEIQRAIIGNEIAKRGLDAILGTMR
ncbi:MAG TPA: acyl-CoA dehydrogenase [Chloroflexota bacterium]|nr:acyl-CoA dehydrogenase [Chloroflexota bacterium]